MAPRHSLVELQCFQCGTMYRQNQNTIEMQLGTPNCSYHPMEPMLRDYRDLAWCRAQVNTIVWPCCNAGDIWIVVLVYVLSFSTQ